MDRITKIDAARRQLDVAIKLWLDEGDLAAVQTLAWAGLTVLRDLARAADPPVNTGPIFFDIDREAANFLKHADRDPDAWLLEIDPAMPELLFHEVFRLYEILAGRLTNEMDTARTVISMKFGLYDSGRRAEERREEERERERRLWDASDHEKEQEWHRMRRQERARHRAFMDIGRRMLRGEPLFPDLKSA